MLGLVLTLVVFALSFFAGTLFGDPLTGELLRLLCLTFFIGGLTSVQGVILSRLMLFRVSFWIGIGTIAFRIAVAIAFALHGFGVWSLVAGSIAGSLAGLVLGMAFVPYWPRLRFNGQYIMSTWRTSSSYFGGGVLFYVNSNVDLFLIGRELGATTLGLYQNARSLTDEVRSRIAIPLQRVLFPAFSALLDERQRLQQSVIRSGRLLSAIVFPIAVGVSSVSEELVPLLYGPQWVGMIPVLKLLGLSAALRGSTAIATPIFNSSNRVGLALRYNSIATVLMIAAVLLAIPEGIVTVATAVALTSLYSLITLRVALQLIGLDAKAMGRMLGAPALASGIAWVVIAALRAVGAKWSTADANMLFGYVAVGTLVYAVALVALSPQYAADLRAVAGKFRKSA
jgi:O-antigen/teichoic acid export membrane protein